MNRNIAIDGPAGAGKSTIARLVAAREELNYVDTGAMYRAVSLLLHKEGVDPACEEKVEEALKNAELTIEYADGVQQVILNGENVNGQIRSENIARMASNCAKSPAVRTMLVDLQRKVAAANPVIMDGRDIGTVVLTDARLKIYLTASVEVRARRRFLELQGTEKEQPIDQIMEFIRSRDEQDMNRPISPLRQAEDAILVDASDLTIEQVVEKISGLYHQRMEA